MLQMRGVSKSFGEQVALRAVDFSVAPGEVVALVGANGAGKSTLMKVLAGLYPDATYTATLFGRPLDLSSPAAALGAGVGVVHQDVHLVPDFTVAENILLGHEPTARFASRAGRRSALHEHATSLLRQAGLDDLDPAAVAGALPVELRQLVQIGRVLSLDSRVVVFDEPTARLNPDGRRRLFAALAHLRATGKMIVFISHYLDEVFLVADRVVVLRDGRVVADRPAANLDVGTLTRLMVGDLASVAAGASAGPGPSVLCVSGLGAEPHFRNVSFAVGAGEVLGIAGIVGSGRHQLIRALIGQFPARGSVTVEGAEICGLAPARVIGRTIGFVPEDRKADGIVADLSVSANLSLPWLRALSTSGVVSRTRVRQRARDLVGWLRLVCASPAQAVGELSGGNQQKAVLGRWFGMPIPVVLLEAPTVGVDVAGKAEIRRLVRSLAEAGAAIVISTDDLWELEWLTHRILVMVRGELAGAFETGSMQHADLLAALGGAGVPTDAAAEAAGASGQRVARKH
jgi:ABC-type sugar transport system ATPase subunit